MKKLVFPLLCLTIAFQCFGSLQAATLTALSTFGGGDGWIAPGDHPRVANDNNQRGLAYNPVSGNVLLVSRTGGTFVQKFDGVTGADNGTLDVTGVSGGTFALNAIGVAGDGAIYAANLTTNSTGATSPYKIYRWDDESAVPSVAFSGGTVAARLGDTLDVIGSGSNTRIVAGHNTAGFNNFSIFTTVDGENYAGNAVTIAGPPNPPAQSFHLGITFTDNDTVIGRGNNNITTVVDINPGLLTAGQVATNGLAPGSTLRPMDYVVLGNGIPVWAVQQTNGNSLTPGANSRLFVYDLSDPNNPVEIAQGNNTLLAPANANGNASGAVAIGKTTYRKAIIYSLDTNNGIQAFELTTVPEPTSLVLCGMGVCLMGALRGRRN